jgi:alkylation response protein AidB-like acyl-CoA dehydrogenase
MQLVLTQDQEDLRAVVRKILRTQSPMSKVRDVVDGKHDYDPELWRRLTRELGLAGLVIPETYGGSGAGHVERSVVLEEMGRALAPTPFLSSAVLAADTLLALDDEPAREELLPGMARGDVRATLAIAETDARWPTFPATTTARRDVARGWLLNGDKTLVVDGMTAEEILVYGATKDGPGFFLVSAGAAGLDCAPLATLDPTRRLARLAFSDTPARKLQSHDPVWASQRVADLAAVALAAEQAGGLAQAMELAVDYAKIRVQFGRLIGSYQAVKHTLVDSYVDWELTTSVVRNAAWVADHSPAELPEAASLAAAVASPAFFRVAARTIQVHGGIGFTWEHDAHLYYKRAKSSELLFADPHDRRTRLADLLGI